MKENLRLELTNPCHENWDAMTASEQGRYCGSCQKTVVDFTTMTDREIISYISLYSNGNTCARVFDGQLNRVIQKPPERKHSWKYFWSLALSSLLISYRSIAQVKTVKGEVVATTCTDTGKPPERIFIGKTMARQVKDTIITEVRGRVVNEDGEPVPFASVTMKERNWSMAADSAGNYLFRIPSTQVTMAALSFSAAGYEPLVSDTINVNTIASLEIIKKTVTLSMKDFVLKKKRLPEVVVIGYGTTRCTRMTGAMLVRVERVEGTTYAVVKQKVTDLLFQSDIKIYPNPAPANGSFTMQFNLKQTGEYNVQFIDASGRIVGGKQIMIASTGQTETFTGNHLPGRGVYFVRVAGKNDNKIYNAKLLVQ